MGAIVRDDEQRYGISIYANFEAALKFLANVTELRLMMEE
jgi:hypothetical protein